MKLLILIFFTFLQFLISISAENASAESKTVLNFNKVLPNRTSIPGTFSNKNWSREVIKYRDIKPSEGDKKAYFFLKGGLNEDVVIIDAVTYEKIISYSLPALEHGISAIVGDSLYQIIPSNGTILSTAISSIVEGPNNISWTHVGSFPSGNTYSYNGVAVDGTLIYFVRSSVGDLYVYDTVSRLVTQLYDFGTMDGYASFIVVQKTLYFFFYTYFYSFDGSTLSTLITPESRFGAGIFRKGNNVCLIGGNRTDVYPDPVYCYSPITKEWHIDSYINEARAYPGIANTQSKTYVFGGRAFFESPDILTFDLTSVEVLDHETNIWSYAPSPFAVGQSFVQALLFYY